MSQTLSPLHKTSNVSRCSSWLKIVTFIIFALIIFQTANQLANLFRVENSFDLHPLALAKTTFPSRKINESGDAVAKGENSTAAASNLTKAGGSLGLPSSSAARDDLLPLHNAMDGRAQESVNQTATSLATVVDSTIRHAQQSPSGAANHEPPHVHESWDLVAQMAIDELRKSTYDRAMANSSCPHTIYQVNHVDSLPDDKYFNCSYPPDLPPIYHCGIPTQFVHPYLWECRLKSRLFGCIDQWGLRNLQFTGIDLGAALGDWLVAVGSYAPQSRLIGVEASLKTHHEMVQHLAANPHLSPDRILVHYAAAADGSAPPKDDDSENAYEPFKQRWIHSLETVHDDSISDMDRAAGVQLLFDEQQKQWKGPTVCLQDNTKGDPGQTYVTASGQEQKCDGDAVPSIAIDWLLRTGRTTDQEDAKSGMIMQPNESLFFLKMDIEGGELSALRGGNHLLSTISIRPCLLYVELKKHGRKGKMYRAAFQLLTAVYNYTDFEDIDTGIQGFESYPPRGGLFSKEGNYEFRLPPKEFSECVQRVKRAAAPAGGVQ